ncbi:hypothetical protein DFH06DRAFT_1253889 [Mycena polygramma]|nr:hypothetical protein DFH06DRAFT_1253863 [Mycena polygramma]KAJ7604724.1 hypothetical protein DFH06DRAFT_1253889 [Mycena polygramma]
MVLIVATKACTSRLAGASLTVNCQALCCMSGRNLVHQIHERNSICVDLGRLRDKTWRKINASVSRRAASTILSDKVDTGINRNAPAPVILCNHAPDNHSFVPRNSRRGWATSCGAALWSRTHPLSLRVNLVGATVAKHDDVRHAHVPTPPLRSPPAHSPVCTKMCSFSCSDDMPAPQCRAVPEHVWVCVHRVRAKPVCVGEACCAHSGSTIGLKPPLTPRPHPSPRCPNQ